MSASNPFDDREKGFEAKYKLDQEQAFRAHAKANKLFGLWAAAQMGISGPEADMYAKTVVEADFDRPGDDDVIEKVRDDLAAKGISFSNDQLIAELEVKRGEAARLIAEG
jgi:hypothetical protein